MITDNRTIEELRVACFGKGKCLADVLAYFNGEQKFPDIERQQMIAIVSEALDHEDPNLVYTAIYCVKKMLPAERKPLETKLTILAKHPDKWIRTAALSALDVAERTERIHGTYFTRLPDAGAMVPAARTRRTALRAV